MLTEKHMQNRLILARECFCGPVDFSKVVSTDEKRFNCDGSDSYGTWAPSGSRPTHNKHQQEGPSIQVWGALLPGPYLYVVELGTRMNARGFVDFLRSGSPPISGS